VNSAIRSCGESAGGRAHEILFAHKDRSPILSVLRDAVPNLASPTA
jgi:hypothetical protein